MTDVGPPPPAAAMALVAAFQQSQVVRALLELGVFDRLSEGAASASTLAEAAHADTASMARLLRAGAVFGLVSPSGGEFALTRIGRMLSADAPGSLQAVARFYLSAHFQEAWAGLPDAVRQGRAAVNIIHDVDSVFEVYGRDPQVAALFDAAMTSLSSGAGPVVAAAYDFAGLCIDVGGGEGRLLAAILEAHPEARGLLFELPQVAEKGRAAIARWGLADRLEVVEGDMFEGALPSHGDIYIMAHVLHDWDDPRARRVLKAVRDAIPAHARLLLVERVIADPVSPSPRDQADVLADINMMVRTGGLERTEAEWRALLVAEGFELTRVLPTAAVNSIVEARPV